MTLAPLVSNSFERPSVSGAGDMYPRSLAVDRDRLPQQFQQENERLKKLLAELILDKAMLEDLFRRKW